MKKSNVNRVLGQMLLGGALALASCSTKAGNGLKLFSVIKDPATVAQLKRFVADKMAQADAATNEPAPEFATLFAAAAEGDWLTVSNTFMELRDHAGQYEHSGKTDERLHGPRWEAVKEVWGGMDCFADGNEKYAAAFGRDIINSIPPGSVYFGGTDPGRFLVTAMCPSQVKGDPFYVLTQNALADGSYLAYLRQIYGNQVYVPTVEDSQHCFQTYTRDVAERSKHNQLLPGESAQTGPDGKVQISGQVAVMNINGLLAKTIFDNTPGRQFFVEESFPLDWMYPQLEPHGLIFKLNRQPAASLPEDVVRADHEYWLKYLQPMIGGWLTDDTPVAAVAAFAEKTFGRHDFSGFTGDRQFIGDNYSHRMFSKLRSSSAGMYAWRVTHAAGAADKERMTREADFAFRQAWALCPYSPEAVYRYANFLLNARRFDDAILVAQTAADLPQSSGNGSLKDLIKSLKQYRDHQQPAGNGI